MVVIVLISLLALIAAPSMSVARNDKIAWDYARQYQTLVHAARARAAGRGAAQLILFGPGGGRGWARVYEALDGTLPADAGPNPVSSCKQAAQWTAAATDPPVLNDSKARFVDWVDLNGTGVVVDMDLKSRFLLNNAAIGVMAICVTPAGVTYVGGDPSSAVNAIAKMQVATPFNDVAEIEVTRHNAGGAVVGLTRRIIIAGSSAPRLKSQ